MINVGEKHLEHVSMRSGTSGWKTDAPGNDVWPLHGKLVNPLERNHIAEFLDVGVRSINSLLTIAKGQRVGIIAGSGVGKSVLLSMMTNTVLQMSLLWG